MRYRTLGRTGWSVGEVGCGTYRSFDIPDGGDGVLALMRANVRCGVNFFDSAPMYGHTEANIAYACARLRPVDIGDTLPPIRIAKKVEQIERSAALQQFETSRRVLGRIDLVQVHNMVGWRVVLPLLAELKADGRVFAVGVTQRDEAAFEEVEAAMHTGLVDTIQVPFNLKQRAAERRLLPLARELAIGVLVMTPICPLFARDALLARLHGLDFRTLTAFNVVDGGGACLKYVISKHPGVVVLPATSRPERVASNVAVSDAPPFPPEIIRDLERRVESS
jgi:aryl-alcohol dehydrogenase-like predicted oxidoreductase